MKKLLIALFFCLLTAGCAPMPSDVENLLDAPKLSDVQYQVDRALREQVGQGVKLKYPKSGSYRSAFTFYDVDNDGQDEAIVLHAYSSGGNAQITVMDLEGDRWVVEKTYPGISPDIDFIRFEQLDSKAGKALVIGWLPESSQKIVAAYRYENRDFTMLGSEDYTQLAIDDFNRDGKCEILVVSAPAGNQPTLIIMGESADGFLDTLDETSLGRQMASFRPPISGYVAPGVYGAVLDGYNERGDLCTSIIQVVDNKLRLPLNADDGILFGKTLRQGGAGGVFSGDVNGDGIIDIPSEWLPAGHENLEAESRLHFTNYINLAENGVTTVLQGFVDPIRGYRFTFPTQWTESDEAITATRQTGSAEITFFIYNKGNITDRSRELLRLQVVDLQSPPKQFDPSAYFLVGKKGGFEYYARLPAGKNSEAQALTRADVERCFTLL